jgi:hypothetical protein
MPDHTLELNQRTDLDLESDGENPVPFNAITEVLALIPYADPVRVGIQALFLSGCRLSEIDNWKLSHLYGNKLYFDVGKNQSGHRVISLSDAYLKEWQVYRQRNKVPSDKFFGFNGETLARYFNKLRPKLSFRWQQKRIFPRKGKISYYYVLQLKGIRKSFVTLDYSKQLDEWKNEQVAVQFTSKAMRHSSERMTAYHYLCQFSKLDMKHYAHMTPIDILRQANLQTRLNDYF